MDIEHARDRGKDREELPPCREISRKRVVRKKIMDFKSILIPILIIAGWLVLYGVILPMLGINT
jgi:hypothetical protein